MDQSTMWDAVHAERRSLARDLDGLSADQWEAPSLCPGWSVHDVLAHLIGSATTTRWGFVRQMAAAQLDFDRTNDQGVGAAPSG
ncbi:maleylpyruvate isomerase family mycothiol-dependent enzyme [Isoptericola rhizosphaerae]|uniref:maleylpyruvate isomerase family mycothiol-dependent enzyme n=1 Tax=Isoptericola rhizosphaerae TaxID=3377837 RepID=UPI00383A3A02